MIRRALTIVVAMAVVAACSDRNPVYPGGATAVHRPTPDALGAVTWAEQVTGETGPGSTYSLNVPTNWNGKLVVYVHGFVDVALPVTLPSIGGLRDAIGAAGYAIAYSSFSENGYNFRDGLQRTHQLRGLFVSKIGLPTQTLVMGHSLGGIITLALAERFPGQYDGALPMCGVVGGTRREIQYIGDVRALFDYFYPGVLPGNAVSLPIITDLNQQIIIPARNAILANPTGAFVMAGVAQTPIPGITPTETIRSVLTALGFHARGLADLTDRAQGRAPFGNEGVTYASAVYGAFMPALNAGVDRFTLAPNASQWLVQNYEPSGALSIPVLTLHTTRDPVVPAFHETILGTRAATAGSSGNLLQRSVDRYGHCTFTGAEMLTALGDLASWVDTGVKPTN